MSISPTKSNVSPTEELLEILYKEEHLGPLTGELNKLVTKVTIDAPDRQTAFRDTQLVLGKLIVQLSRLLGEIYAKE